MSFNLEAALAVLSRTPATLKALLHGLPESWIRADEGPETWSPYDIVGHLIHGEKTDWLPRARIILEHGEERTFEPFDRFAQLRDSAGAPDGGAPDGGKSLAELLAEFAALRAENLVALRRLDLGAAELALSGRHPELGTVTLGQLLATWVAHDLGHIAQIGRVMARQYTDDVGPWRAYMPILGPRPRPA